MRFAILLLSGVLLSCATSMTRAEPLVHLTWGVGPFHWCEPAMLDRVVLPGSRPEATVWLLGHDAPHADFRLELELYPGDGGPFPDAWRFDSLGCAAAGELLLTDLPVPYETCLRYFGPRGVHLRDRSVRFDAEAQRLRITWWSVYVPHLDPNPLFVYALLRLGFDHTASVTGPGNGTTTCGGVERALCIRLLHAQYLDLEGAWVPWTIDPSTISANAGSPAVCFTVPAAPGTWGRIKAWYR